VTRQTLSVLGQAYVDDAVALVGARRAAEKTALRLQLRSRLVGLLGKTGPVPFSPLVRLDDTELTTVLTTVLKMGARSLDGALVRLVGRSAVVDAQIADFWAARPEMLRTLSSFCRLSARVSGVCQWWRGVRVRVMTMSKGP
jgi:hypothetical protein